MAWAVGVAAAVRKPFRARPVSVYRKIDGFVMVGDGPDGSCDHARLTRRGFLCGRVRTALTGQHSPTNARVLNMLTATEIL